MSGLLIGAGAVALLAGAVMIGFGIPINEFSFGNTLIGAGTTAVVGGLIVIALGVVVGRLQRIAEALAIRTPIRSSRPVDMFESEPGPRFSPVPGRAPFPARAKSPFAGEPPVTEPAIAQEVMTQENDKHVDLAQGELPMEAPPAEAAAPTLRNPDEPPVTVEDEVSLSPRHPNFAAAPAADHAGGREQHAATYGFSGSSAAEQRQMPMTDSDWQSPPAPPVFAPTRQPHTTYFDAMWPAESKTAKSPAGIEAKAEPKFHAAPRETEAGAPLPPPVDEPTPVAILKSGVVDGMGYTLYVDGSIEAELPDGTLRFASINELRSHLENNP